MSEIKRADSSSSKLALLTSNQTRNNGIEMQKAEKETISEIKQKNKDAVLFEICESEKILHSMLANRIPLSASGLNAVIKKLNEAKIPPIHIDKQGKFTFYSLEDAGKIYIQEELMPTMASNVQDEERVHNIFKLLSAFKDQNPNKWMSVLRDILNGKEVENFEEGCGFIKELGTYYLHSCEEAENLLNLAIVDKELQKEILDYIKESASRTWGSVWEILNYWLQEDNVEVYRLIDSFFTSIVGNEEMPECCNFALTDIADHIDAVLNKIQTGLLQALLRRISKWEAVQIWIEYGLDKNLAVYLAEKYFIYCLQYEQKIEQTRKCV